MASKKYTNADLKPRQPLGVTYAKADAPASPPYTPEPSIEALLAAAKGALTRADQFQQGYQQDIAQAGVDQSQREQLEQQDLPPVMDSPATTLARLAKGIPEALDLAAVPAMFIPGANVPAAVWMGARGAQRVAEGGMQRVKEHPFRTALDAAMVVPLARAGLKAAAGSAAKFLTPTAAEAPAYRRFEQAFKGPAGSRVPPSQPRSTAPFEGDRTWLWENNRMPARGTRQQPSKLALGREVLYQNRTPSANPNQIVEMAREIAAETGEPFGQVLKGYAKSGGVSPEQRQALEALATVARPSRFRALPSQGASLEHPMTALSNMTPDEFRGPQEPALAALMTALNKLPKTAKRKVG